MKKFILACIGMLLVAKAATAQEQLSIKQQADKLFDRYEYFKSLQLYLKLAERKNADVKLMERVATCYRYINQYAEAGQWYERIIANPKAEKLSHYFYAEVLLRNQKFEQAKQQYRIYFTEDAGALALKLNDCDSAIVWMKQSSAYKVTNAIAANTQSSDWGASYDGKTGIIFTSDRETGDGKTDNRTGNGWFKLYEYDLTTKETKALIIDAGNSPEFKGAYHVGPMALNAQGDTAYITLSTETASKNLPIDKRTGQRLYTRRLQLVTACKKGDRWVICGGFAYNNVKQYSVGNAALSKNGRFLYFSSDMPGGLGKTDLWYCQKETDGSWAKPVNCGNKVNTKEEENFPFVDDNGVLYYASKGLPGMGGYEIYTAIGSKANWSSPKNLKYPINSTSDDFNLITHDGLGGYLSSNRENGQGNDDIYEFALVKDSIKIIKPLRSTPGSVITSAVPSLPGSVTGLPAAGYTTGIIYYDLDKSFIRPDAAAELNKLVDVLKQYPGLKVVLSSYCDSRASYLYNLALSQRRAKAAVAYLVKNGIAITRMTAKGYSKSNLVNQCADHVKCSETDHQLNRRTEIKVVQ
ncbi:OmpA family protein [Mucilaginibacter dorajii]|uniref:OmpA family protein n=1 Tax=Mucilaginibacter dorajii TaxID=692994 RepID=A0ABP7P3M5_9SPHI|nr:OmpA family protein [Mucilaginibacter dorajii]MCS3734366.1 outer membrane protein OmpA-like peptidoglycan-associated protein [Mucilaginibacter dorajii]